MWKEKMKGYLIVVMLVCGGYSVRVCKNFNDYKDPFSPNCYNNPDGERNIVSH